MKGDHLESFFDRAAASVARVEPVWTAGAGCTKLTKHSRVSRSQSGAGLENISLKVLF